MPRPTPRYTMACAVCDKLFTVKEHRRDTARYCSRACQHTSQSQRESRTCPQCGDTFVAVPGEYKRGHAIYCSIACRGLAKRVRITIACAHCGTPFDRSPARAGDFCSHGCYNEAHKSAYICERCGKTIRLDASDAPARYCSRACKEARTPEDDAARFWANVDKSGDCWLWTASTYHAGYGRFSASGKAISAHRWSYEAAFGPLPADTLVQHSCDTPGCVNPAHLFPGTNATNTEDAMMKGRNVRGERCHTAKVTAEQVREIRGLHASGTMTQTAIAKRYGVRSALVGRIVRRESWQHL